MKIMTIILFLGLTCFAKEKHREHGAHVHGDGKLAIAFDDTKGKIEFKGAAEGILGFEHKAKNAKDKKTLSEAILFFENNISKMIQFDSSLNCQFTKEMIGQVAEEGEEGSGDHSDWAANFAVTCDKSPLGSKLTIDFAHFKRLKDIDVTILAGSIQKSVEFKGKPITTELK